MNIAALVSGGVDSSVVVHLLKEQGYNPDIFYIRIGMEAEDGYIDCPAEEDIEITTYIAKKYGCRFEEVNLHKEYWDNVVSYTIESVKKGLTPNPDVMCNKMIKFGAFDQRCGKDYDRIATGHYARTESGERKTESGERKTENGERKTENGELVTFLATAKDPLKDQTDFLTQLTYPQIQKAMFPIGHLMKSEVRDIAHRAKLPSADRKDSQGICFLGKINYNDFIRRYLGEKEGKIVELETGKILGTHKGYWFHTIGQRKGLYLSGGPWFVVKKDIEENILYVSQGYTPEAQYGKEINLLGFHYLSADIWNTPAEESPADDWSVEVLFKIRHTPEFAHGRLTRISDPVYGSIYHLSSDTKIQGIASGQYASIYDCSTSDSGSHLLIASGMIL